MKKLISVIFLFVTVSIHAQITPTVATANQCVQNLVSTGIQFSNIQIFSSSPNSFATFTGGNNAGIGFNNGVYMATGDIPTYGLLSSTPNSMTFSNSNFAPGGDPDLNAIATLNTYDVTILQFDFIPTGDTVKFKYVFASEEYNEYVNTIFNDVFGFFITGPNPSGPAYNLQNIAIIPNSTANVAINNVNNGNAGGCASGPCNNCQYYVDNLCQLNNFVFDGHTAVLTAIAPVVPCSTYTIKLAIGDVGDGALDSGVFLEAESFSSNAINVESAINYGGIDTLLFEACGSASLIFTRSGDIAAADSFNISYTGTATMGQDYANLPSTVIFPPGEDTVIVTLDMLGDALIETLETIAINLNINSCNTITGNNLITLYIVDVQNVSVAAPPDTFFCANSPVLFEAQVTGGTILNQVAWLYPTTGSFPDSTTINVAQTGYYTALAVDMCTNSIDADSFLITVFPAPVIQTLTDDICSGTAVTIGDPNGNANLNWDWSPNNLLNSVNISNPTFTFTNTGNADSIFTYYVSVDSAGVVCSSDSAIITVHPNPTVNITPDSSEVCSPASVNLTADAGFSAYSWSQGGTTASVDVNNSGWFTVTVTDGNNCQDEDSSYVVIYPVYSFTLNDEIICSNADVEIGFTNLPSGFNISWSPDSNLSDGNISNPIFEVTNTTGAPEYFTLVASSDSAGFVCFSDTMELVVVPFPELNLPLDTTYFCENGDVTLDAGPGFNFYAWNTGENTQTITVNQQGWYNVEVTDSVLCFAKDSIFVVNLFIPVFELEGSTFCEGDTLVLTESSWMGDFEWNTGSTDTLLYVTTDGQFWLKITNVCGTGYDTIVVDAIPNLTNVVLPNVFSPNADGQNDEYKINDIEFAEWFELYIYNRWGHLVFESKDANTVWKGEANTSTDASNGVYFVLLNYENCQGEKEKLQGTISIFR
jgi:gliding motility-associated-like protein